MTNLSYIITNQSISVFFDGQSKVITKDHQVFNDLKDAIKANDVGRIKTLLDVKKNIEEFGEGKVALKDGIVYYEGKPINSYLTRKIVELQREGFKITPLLKFLENLEENPSYRAREELYQFLEYGKLPITEDGYFIAYKKVRGDYKDIYSGQFDNSVGAVCEMDRRNVDDDSSRTCSAGLHFASREYMSHYGAGTGNKVMAVKINPKDVVAIPQDYNNTKGRCCRYEVVAELSKGETFDTLEDKAVFKEPKKKAKKKSKVTGVTFDKKAGKWKAQLPKKPKKGSRHLGYFKTREEAEQVVAKRLGR